MARVPESMRLILMTVIAFAFAEALTRFVVSPYFPSVNDPRYSLVHVSLVFVFALSPSVWHLYHRRTRSRRDNAPARRDMAWKLSLMVIAVLLTGLVFTTWATIRASDGVKREARIQFDRLTERLSAEIQNRVNQATFGLRGIAGVYSASAAVEREEFRAYVESKDLANEFPGVCGFGFIQRVLDKDLDAFVARERADNAPNFSVKSPTLLAGLPPPAEMYIVKFIEPLKSNRGAWGFDISSDPVRRGAAVQAVRTGSPTLTPLIQLMQNGSAEPGFLYMLAVYKNGAVPLTPLEREDLLLGLVYAPIASNTVLRGVVDAANGDLNFRVFEGDVGSNGPLLYGHTSPGDGRAEDSTSSAMFCAAVPFVIGGRTWTITTSTTAQFESAVDRSTPDMIRIGGTMLSVLLASIVLSLGLSRSHAVSIADDMALDVHAGEARLRAVFDAEPECVKVLDASGRLIDMNPAGLGMIEADSLDQVRGSSVFELLCPEHRDQFASDMARVLAGERIVSTFEIKGFRGQRRWMEQTAVALDDISGARGVLAVARDITKRRADESRLADNERRFRTLVEGTDVIIWEYDPAADSFTYVSPQAATLGYPIEDWYRKGFWQSTIHPEDREDAVAYCVSHKHMGGSYRFQYRMVAADNRIVWIDDFVTVELHAASDAITLRGVLLDITAQKHAELQTQAMLDLTSRLTKSEQVGAAANAVLDTLELLYQAQGRTAAQDPSLRSAVLIYGFDDVCRFVASRGLSTEYQQAVAGHCPWKQGTLDALPIVLNDSMSDPSLAAYRDLFQREHIGALAFIPLQTERGVVGKIMLYARNAGELSQPLIEITQNIASTAGMSLGRIIATRSLEQSERRLRTIIETEPECVSIIAADGTLLEMNSAGLAMFETDSIDSLRAHSLKHFVLPEYHGEFAALHQRVMSGTAGTLTFEIMGLRGTRRWLDTHAAPMLNQAGTVTAVLCVTRDITSHRLAQDALAQREEAYRTLFEAVPAAVFVCDADAVIQQYNRRAVELWGREPVLGVEKHCGSLRLYLPDGTPLPHDQTPLMGVLKTGEPTRGVEVLIERPDGSRVPVSVNFAALRGDHGGITGTVVSFDDISIRKRAESQLIAARHAAEAASKAKSEFLANMSHEIRTPLTAILGFADLLREDGDISIAPSQRLQTIDTIKNAGSHLLTVINDILDLSKIEADKMTVERIDTPLIGVLREVQTLLRPRAVGKGVSLSTEFASLIPERIVSDPTRLRQILMNLVGNAVKFTDAGHVTVTAQVTQSDGRPRLQIDVADSGVGMTPEQAERLFVAFAQADNTVTRKHGGTGLGLTISSRLARLMGGTVTLHSTSRGHGSCFRVDLPLECAANSAMISQLEASMESEPCESGPARSISMTGRILVAEDGLDNQRLIAFHLRKAGATVEIAGNGRIALEMIDAAERAAAPFDLLLTDMQMPEMDGYTLARTLRGRGSALPIVAITAHAMAEDRDRCTDAGCNDYTTKPIDKATLLATCAAWIGTPGSVRRNAA